MFVQFGVHDGSPLHIIVWYLPPDYVKAPRATQSDVMRAVQKHRLMLPDRFRVLLMGDANIQTVRNQKGIMVAQVHVGRSKWSGLTTR